MATKITFKPPDGETASGYLEQTGAKAPASSPRGTDGV
jgi:hypothetical protein